MRHYFVVSDRTGYISSDILAGREVGVLDTMGYAYQLCPMKDVFSVWNKSKDKFINIAKDGLLEHHCIAYDMIFKNGELINWEGVGFDYKYGKVRYGGNYFFRLEYKDEIYTLIPFLDFAYILVSRNKVTGDLSSKVINLYLIDNDSCEITNLRVDNNSFKFDFEELNVQIKDSGVFFSGYEYLGITNTYLKEYLYDYEVYIKRNMYDVIFRLSDVVKEGVLSDEVGLLWADFFIDNFSHIDTIDDDVAKRLGYLASRFCSKDKQVQLSKRLFLRRSC